MFATSQSLALQKYFVIGLGSKQTLFELRRLRRATGRVHKSIPTAQWRAVHDEEQEVPSEERSRLGVLSQSMHRLWTDDLLRQTRRLELATHHKTDCDSTQWIYFLFIYYLFNPWFLLYLFLLNTFKVYPLKSDYRFESLLSEIQLAS